MIGDFRVGDWDVQPSVNRVRRGDEVVRLEPKVMQVLTRLALAPGEVVAREELIAHVWPDVFVTGDVLHRAIRELRRVFGDSPATPLYVETIRKRGYRLIAPTSPLSTGPTDADLRPRSQNLHVTSVPDLRPRSQNLPATSVPDLRPVSVDLRPRPAWAFSLVAAAMTVLCALGVLAVAWRAGNTAPQARARFVPLVSGPLNESDPAISPDGRLVAYVQREAGDDTSADIYIRDLVNGQATRLTTHPASDRMPAWSRDARQIAFVRATPSTCDIVVRTLATGAETVVAACSNREDPRVAWVADGSSLVMSYAPATSGQSALRIARVDLATGGVSVLTDPPPGTIGDHSPVVSPDGRTLAFIRRSSGGVADIYTVPQWGGAARRMTFDDADLTGIDWTGDGRSILFSSDRAGGYTLWEAGIDGSEPTLVAGGAARMKHPMADRTGRRVVYENWYYEINLWEMALDTGQVGQAGQAGSAGRRLRPLTRTSDLWNLYPQISPDGTQVAYVSTQSGSHELWLSDREGADARQLTHAGRGVVKEPRWSPDGKRIAYLARQSGTMDVHVIDVSSGAAVALTGSPANKVAPAWSHDGRDVLFGAPDPAGQWHVWAVDSAAPGQSPRRLIANAVAAQSSPDGAWRYFTRADRPGLWRARVSNPESVALVVEAVPAGYASGWLVTSNALYYTADGDGGVSLHMMPLTGSGSATRASLDQMTWPGFSIAPGGTHVLYARWDRRESNIMSIEY